MMVWLSLSVALVAAQADGGIENRAGMQVSPGPGAQPELENRAGMSVSTTPAPQPVVENRSGMSVAPNSPPAAPAVSWPRWSVGTGLGLFDGVGLAALGGLAGQGGLGGLGGLSVINPSPTPRLTFERLFGEHVALALGVFGDYQSIQESNFERGGVGALLGPRFILTNPDAVVAVSAYAAALVSYSIADLSQFSSSSLTIGGAGGLALERWLIERLAIRIQVQLIRATWSETQSRAESALGGVQSLWAHSTQVSFIPGPSVELRLYF